MLGALAGGIAPPEPVLPELPVLPVLPVPLELGTPELPAEPVPGDVGESLGDPELLPELLPEVLPDELPGAVPGEVVLPVSLGSVLPHAPRTSSELRARAKAGLKLKVFMGFPLKKQTVKTCPGTPA